MAEENGAAAAKEVTFTALKAQLVVPTQKAEAAVEFYKAAFGAEEVQRSTYPKRKADQDFPLLLCAEVKIGDSSFLICDQADDSAVSGGSLFRLETCDVEGAVSKAVKAGAAIAADIAEDEDGCCGGVVSKVMDPFGVTWTIASVKGSKKQCEPQA